MLGHDERKAAALKVLEDAGVAYELIEHEPVHTMEDLEGVYAACGVRHPKNLFLVSQNGPERRFHALVRGDKRVRTRELGRMLGSRNPGFGSAELLGELMGLEPGAVSPLGLANDTAKTVEPVIDSALLGEERVALHPSVNDATVIITVDDLMKIYTFMGREPLILEVPEVQQ